MKSKSSKSVKSVKSVKSDLRQSSAYALIGGRRGYGVREILTLEDSGHEIHAILGANDAQGRMELCSRPVKVNDGRIEKVRGVDGLIVPVYLGTTLVPIENGDLRGAFPHKGTWIFTSGRKISVLLDNDTAENCGESGYIRKDVIPLVRLIGGKLIPWQGEPRSVGGGRNAHEVGCAFLGKR